MNELTTTHRCPCGTGLTYGECCNRFHSGVALAPTAEALMRSRFSAFSIGDGDYLLRTWDPASRPEMLNLDPSISFYRLDILETAGGGPFDTRGRVKFRAFYRGAAAGVQEEDSVFHRVDGKWVYSSGNVVGQAPNNSV
ncbi:YchJ family protein [Corynebacterium pacaense]|uniref:YchJ family protein n=1 Tax=Corynebacterium pacaense TaxID=1816684 RepID=UPI0009BBD19E|nr:YchJ family metal-binding protein [Corynebacterium pacaense]